MHQTCTRLLLNLSVDLLRVIKLRWKLNLIKKLSTEGHAAHIKTNVTSYDWFTKVLFYSVHRLKVWCIDAHISAMHRWNQPMNKTTQPYNGAQRYKQFLQVGRLYQALILLGLALCLLEHLLVYGHMALYKFVSIDWLLDWLVTWSVSFWTLQVNSRLWHFIDTSMLIWLVRNVSKGFILEDSQITQIKLENICSC